MKAIILAGGFGTRMGEMCRDTPKPMLEICGKPILLHQIETLKKEGISEFIIITGYLSEKIEAFFGDGRNYGVKISYYRERTPLGTAGALFRLNLKEDFLLCNGDLIFDISVRDMLSFHREKRALATLLVHPNNHPYDSLTLDVNENNQVINLYPKNSKPDFYPNLCNAGIQIISGELLQLYDYSGSVNLDRDVIGAAIHTNRIFAYKSSEYVHDAGTPERLKRTEQDIRCGTVAGRNRKKAQRAVFIDRDGTLNKHKGYITDPYEIELTEGAAEAVSAFGSLGYLVIVITNQPVIARGECTEEELGKIHNYLEKLLAERSAYVDGIYYCPHHPDRGFKGEVKELKIDCECRKPSPGLILKAQKDFNIDLSESFMVGDMLTDVETAENASCIPVLIGGSTCKDILTFDSLYEFSKYLTARNRQKSDI